MRLFALTLALALASAAHAGKVEHHLWRGTTTCTDIRPNEDDLPCSTVLTVTLKLHGRPDAFGTLDFRGVYLCSGSCIRKRGKLSGMLMEITDNGMVTDSTLNAMVTFKGGQACIFYADTLNGDAPPNGISGNYWCYMGRPDPAEMGDLVLIRVK